MKTLKSILRVIVNRMLDFDRKVLKRYLNIQTPLYRLWWAKHCRLIQTELDTKNNKY